MECPRWNVRSNRRLRYCKATARNSNGLHLSFHGNETGIANVIVAPNIYEQHRSIVTRSKFIRAEGQLQNQEGVIHVKAVRLIPLSEEGLEVRSHDFH